MAQPSNPGLADTRLSGEGWFSGTGLFDWIARHVVPKPLTLRSRALVLAAVGWAPLIVLAFAQQIVSGQSQIAMRVMREPEIHVRFLIAVPLLVLAEATIDPAIGKAARHFVVGHLVEDCARFREMMAHARNPKGRRLVDPLLLLLAEAVSFTSRDTRLRAEVIAWTHVGGSAAQSLTWPGIWYTYVGLPIFLFLMLRWLFRWCVWATFLARVARLDLKLFPTHPDEAAGLAFLAGTSSIFAPVIFAWSSVQAAILATELARGIMTAGAVHRTIIAYTVAMLAFFSFPHAFFTPRLFWLRRGGVRHYGAFGQRIAASLEDVWVTHDSGELKLPPESRETVSSDAAMLADYGKLFRVVRLGRLTPLDCRALLSLLAACLVPMIAVALVEVPVAELARKVVSSLL